MKKYSSKMNMYAKTIPTSATPNTKISLRNVPFVGKK